MNLNNLKSFHHRLMMKYLRKRGWVVFYLEEKVRKCNDMCWLKLYEEELKREKIPKCEHEILMNGKCKECEKSLPKSPMNSPDIRGG